jgi:dipeptidyl aminopeptidase/acylaminoacyl peptidase
MPSLLRYLLYMALALSAFNLPGSNILLISSNYTGRATGNGGSSEVAITPDGRYVAFSSGASDLRGIGTNASLDVYLLDRATGIRRCISSPSNFPPNFPPSAPAYAAQSPVISDDGRFVGFLANHGLLVPEITNYPPSRPWNFFVYDAVSNRYFLGSPNGNARTVFPESVGAATLSSDGGYSSFLGGSLNDYYRGDLEAGISERVNVDLSGNVVFISNVRAHTPNHRYFVFGANASNVVANPPKTDQTLQVYRRDMDLGITTLVSVATNGGYASTNSFARAISLDGRYVAFRSRATNLQPGMGGGAFDDVWIRDMVANETWCVTVNASGTGSLGNSAGIQDMQFSEDARRLLFQTTMFPGGFIGTLFVHELASRTNRLLATSVFSEATRFSDNGRYALYCRGSFDLMSIDVETLRRQRVGRLGGWLAAPPLSAVRISTDGRWTFFTSHTNEVAGVSDTNSLLDVFAAPTISPRIESVAGTGPRTVEATAFPGDTVQLLRSSDLLTWETVASGQTSGGGTITLQDSAIASPNVFYRLRSP